MTDTSARPRGALPEVPAKMTSSIFPPRRLFAPCSPITQERASTTLLLPEPFGPTTQVIPGSNFKVVGAAKDLKPFRVMLFKYTGRTYRVSPRTLGFYPRLGLTFFLIFFFPAFFKGDLLWHCGQKCDERFAKAILRISQPHLEQGSFSWPYASSSISK